ncbi:retinol dehydrogenase 12-like [Adelges cooleyi]|uniref:retinol dehydrogenase 12-like n=1 Tax=Adelges cooleyi TaxID=133065 RepID=UPI00217F370E|nr:retinol dehydrogenase 12-like [Adelges cooleyi]
MVNIIKIWPYASAVLSLYIIKRYFAGGVCQHEPDLTDKVIIVTGGTTGIGKEVATVLAERGARVIICSRDEVRGTKVCFEILKSTGNPNIYFFYLDLNSFSSIREFSRAIHERFDAIYALVNNAGVFYHPFVQTEDDFDVTFQTNYLGPFLLTHLLLNIIRASGNGRIVNVSSEAHRYLHILNPRYVDELGTRSNNRFIAYAASKACLQLFTYKLSQTLSDCGVTANDANPGNVKTQILDGYFKTYHPLLLKLQTPLRWLLIKTPRQGAQTILHLLLSPDLQDTTGKYFTDCKECDPCPLTRNQELAEQLWIRSLAWINKK